MGFYTGLVGMAKAASSPTIGWEEVACLLCGSREQTPLIEAPDLIAGGSGLWFFVVQCQECGLCFTNPRPAAAALSRFYPRDYRPHRSANRPHIPRSSRSHWLRTDRERRALPLQGNGRLLDFGCGGGSYLQRMHRQGWQVTGLDVSADAVRRVRENLGLPVLCGSLPHPDLQPGQFAVITMWHALEHVPYPLEVLREAHRLLTPGGKVVVAVPNIDSLAFRWFGASWIGLDLPRHLTHFTPRTLHQLLERAGFRPEPIRMVRHSGWLQASARLACRERRAPHWQRWLTSRVVARLATGYSYLTRQSDCMLASAVRD